MDNYTFLGVPLTNWIYVILLVVSGWMLGFFLQKFIKKLTPRLKKLSVPNIIMKASDRPIRYMFIFIGATIAFSLMVPPDKYKQIFDGIFMVLRGGTMACVVWFLLKAIDGFSEKAAERAAKTDSKLDDMAVPIIRGLAKVFVTAVGILVILQNLGYSVSSLLAGLGIGGAAVALASKDTLANFFGSLVVFVDKPFEIGDWVIINGIDGVVHEIRLRTTIIRTWDHSLVTIPNSLLTSASINNYQRCSSRRLNVKFGVYYTTTSEQLKGIVDDIKQHVTDHPEIFDKVQWIGFDGFGDSSLDISITVYTHEINKAKHLALRQDFLFEIMKIVEKHGTGFAFPTRTLDMTQLRQQPLRIAFDTGACPMPDTPPEEVKPPTQPMEITSKGNTN